MKAEEGDGSHRVARRRGRVLEGLAARIEYAQLLAFIAAGIEKTSCCRIGKFLYQSIGNSPGKVEVCDVGSRFIRIQARNRRGGVVIEQTWDLAVGCFRRRISDNVR